MFNPVASTLVVNCALGAVSAYASCAESSSASTYVSAVARSTNSGVGSLYVSIGICS